MSESKIETATRSTTTIDSHTPSISLSNDDVFYSHGHTPTSETILQSKYETKEYQRRNSDISGKNSINSVEDIQRSSSTNVVDQLSNKTILTNILYDPCTEYIQRPNNKQINYRQDISIRYLEPPTPPPPAPIIIREIRAPQVPEPTPLVICRFPPAPITPPPLIIRERPPTPPPVEPPRIITRYLPAPQPSPRKVIIERQAALPQKPQPIIIEKWLPYKTPPKRRVVVERDQPLVERPIQKNKIITHDAPHVNIVQNIHNLGTVRVDPHKYTAQYGSSLSSSEYIRNTMAKFGIGNNYPQMIQMQSSTDSSTTNNNHLKPMDDSSTINNNHFQPMDTFSTTNNNHLQPIADFSTINNNHPQAMNGFSTVNNNYLQAMDGFSTTNNNYLQPMADFSTINNNHSQAMNGFSTINNNYLQPMADFSTINNSHFQPMDNFSTVNNNYLQAIDNFYNQPAITYEQHMTSSSRKLHNGGQCEYIQQHMEQTMLPDGRQRYRLNINGSNRPEISYEGEFCN